ncbi:uncharacterized protein LOC104891779 [Beta vulgaris subsp. vulgaris]|uniref:uncharacterized protein LOC104891779 n=1 Tax=Beta vulgaris subsp. vulgaris TaxID=3555 RepID=UPI00053F42F5|nr:uncharacterized protein LOC104891779 [Beta vulgaris subsp. vulgaris]
MEENRGSLSFFTTYRPTVKLDIYSCPISPTSIDDEICMTDELSYNSNGHFIEPEALKIILQHPKIASESVDEEDVDSGHLTGLIFVSERENGLETLHLSLRLDDEPPVFEVFPISHVYDTFDGVRMEDSGCIAGDYLIYVTTKDPALERRQPWTAVYKTHLITGETTRLTPEGEADLSPAVSPCGTKIAMASFEGKPGGWDGEIEYLNTNIFVMNVEEPYNREMVVEDGSWPTWGSEDVLFFHKKDGAHWGVFRADISEGGLTSDITRVTPDDIDAITPAAIDDTKVVVATIRKSSDFSHAKRDVDQYRHIEIYDSSGEENVIKITKNTKPMADHYNPFVLTDFNGEMRIGYHRCNTESLDEDGTDLLDKLEEVQSPEPGVDLFRMSGAFPSFSKDHSKLAFVDNEFKTVYVIDSQGSHIVYQAEKQNSVFSPVWSQESDKDTLYVCEGPAFKPDATVEICAILDACSGGEHQVKRLTNGSNNAFPCTNPDGTKLVFRSTRDGGENHYKNLYIIEDLDSMEDGEGEITRLTNGPWVDTHCEWSPNGEWIVFASNRHRTTDDSDHGLDTGYFAVYLVKADDPDVWVKVIGSRSGDLAGHVNHPFFSPDGRSLSVVADLAAVSCDPISMPLFIHSVRPYGDLFILDIDEDDIYANEDVEDYRRITHTRYENSTAVWSDFSSHGFSQVWNEFFTRHKHKLNNHLHDDGGETWHSTGHICVHAPKRC